MASIELPGFGLLATGLRYALAGAFTTLLCLALILGLQFGASVPANLANAAGYALGVSVTFLLGRRFVFRRPGVRPGAPGRYCAAVALAFGLNQLVLTGAARLFPPGMAALAQLLAVGSYSLALFLLCHAWVFASRGGNADAR